MGARQSHLNIYLKSNETSYSGTGYTVTVTKAVASQSINYDVVTHTIKYEVGKGTNFDIYIYDNEKTVSNASYVFAYCSPGVESHVVKEVKAYYSILLPMIPLVISFVREKNDTYACGIDKLERVGWDWAKNITTYSGDLVKQLDDYLKKLLWKRTIGFMDGNVSTNGVIAYPRRIDDNNYRLIFLPSSNESVLNVNCLFTFDTEPTKGVGYSVVQVGCKTTSTGLKNQIDPYFLESVTKKVVYYDGIIVYFSKEQDQKEEISLNEKHHENSAFLLEFISSNTKTHIQRKDKNGTYWVEEKVNYSDYASLTRELNSIKSSSEGYDKNTVIIDRSSYIGVVKVNKDNKPSYNKYRHEFQDDKEPNILFQRKTIIIGTFSPSTIKTKQIDVFYLKYSTEKSGEQDDGRPFLIAIYTNGKETPEKAYHFTIEKDDKDNFIDYFKEWKELEAGKFEDRIRRIDSQTGCTGELHYRKKLVYRILTNDESKPPPDPAEPPVQERPKVDEEPPEPPPGRNWWLIIGCSVGGFLLLVALVVGYGIYWYNTTIKLLT